MKTRTALAGASIAALIAAGGVGYGYTDPSSPALGPVTSILGAFVLGHVANNASLANLPARLGHVHRDGFATAGDGGAADYTLGQCPSGLTPDGGSLIALNGGGCAVADFGDKAPSIKIWGAKNDSNGTSGNGTDNAPFIQAAINWANPQSRKLYAPGGLQMYRVVATLQAPGNGTIEGDGVDPGSFVGSVLFFDNLSNGIVYAGNWYFRNFGTFRAQPAPSTTAGVSWVPCACGYDFYQVAGEGHLENMFLIDATNGIYLQTGRGQFSYQGQIFQIGINAVNDLDTVSIRQTRNYPYYSVNPNVTAYTLANAVGILGARFDNPEIVDYFGISLNSCIRFVTNSTATAPVTTSRLGATNVGCDGNAGNAIDFVGAGSVTGAFVNVYSAPAASGRLFAFDANSQNNDIQFLNTRFSGPGAQFSSSGVINGYNNTVTATNYRVDGWGNNDGGAAVNVTFGNMFIDNDLVPDISGGPTTTSPYFGGTAFQIPQGGYLKLLNGSGTYELAYASSASPPIVANAEVAVGGGATNLGVNVGGVFQSFAAGGTTTNLEGSTSSGKIGIGYSTDQSGYIITNNTGAATTVFYRFHKSFMAN